MLQRDLLESGGSCETAGFYFDTAQGVYAFFHHDIAESFCIMDIVKIVPFLLDVRVLDVVS